MFICVSIVHSEESLMCKLTLKQSSQSLSALELFSNLDIKKLISTFS